MSNDFFSVKEYKKIKTPEMIQINNIKYYKCSEIFIDIKTVTQCRTNNCIFCNGILEKWENRKNNL